ncbi:hypothetical protein Leryth_008221 [Lithospermum erythrorhizon]|nr:hypothetical protein Leryth_008221 [Lithospermum erythrorhizon]
MVSDNVEIVEIDDVDDNDDILCLSGSSKKNPILLEVSDDEEPKGVSDLNVEFIDVEPSPVFSTGRLKRAFDLNLDYIEDEVHLIDDLPPPRKRNKCETSLSKIDHDDGDLDSTIMLDTFKCDICVDDKPMYELFVIKSCNHHYCSECITRYVASKLDDNIPHITCPITECKGLLDLEECQEILPAQVFDRWGDALCESLFPASQKVYCPYKTCSGLLIDDCKRGKRVIKKSECLHCKRLFCFQCRSPWHEKINCEEFQKLNKDGFEAEDIMLMKLAKTKKWQRCPICKFYVQRNRGCPHMSCRCGHQFCYRCGLDWPQCNGSCK